MVDPLMGEISDPACAWLNVSVSPGDQHSTSCTHQTILVFVPLTGMQHITDARNLVTKFGNILTNVRNDDMGVRNIVVDVGNIMMNIGNIVMDIGNDDMSVYCQLGLTGNG
jgi:hypothetical protein